MTTGSTTPTPTVAPPEKEDEEPLAVGHEQQLFIDVLETEAIENEEGEEAKPVAVSDEEGEEKQKKELRFDASIPEGEILETTMELLNDYDDDDDFADDDNDPGVLLRGRAAVSTSDDDDKEFVENLDNMMAEVRLNFGNLLVIDDDFVIGIDDDKNGNGNGNAAAANVSCDNRSDDGDDDNDDGDDLPLLVDNIDAMISAADKELSDIMAF